MKGKGAAALTQSLRLVALGHAFRDINPVAHPALEVGGVDRVAADGQLLLGRVDRRVLRAVRAAGRPAPRAAARSERL